MNSSLSTTVFLLIVVFLLPALVHVVGALRCKCSNSKGAAPCRDGVCAIGDDDERFAACVALNHSITGMHYACAHRDSDEQTCDSKRTKSGAVVTACFCSKGDFCNGINWPPPPTADPRTIHFDNNPVVKAASSLVQCTFLNGLVVSLLAVFLRLMY